MSRALKDIGKACPQHVFNTIFDVGGNVGQSVSAYRSEVSYANIWSFEPISATHSVLADQFADDDKVHCIQMALGSAEQDSVLMTSVNGSTMNSVVSKAPKRGPTETVKMTTGDAFCKSRDIGHINFLKIDTEGHDLEVLKGFGAMLSSASIDFIQVETGMHKENTRHVNFRVMLSFLEQFGYGVFGFYDQTRERLRPALLRRANVVFSSPTMTERIDA